MLSTTLRLKTEYRVGPLTGFFFGMGAFIGVVLFLVLVEPSVGGFPAGSLWIRVAILVGAVLVYDFLTLTAHPTRWIELGPESVTFGYITHRDRAPWKDLTPSPKPAERGWWYVRSPAKLSWVTSTRAHAITITQARQLLRYPACAKWDLPPEVVASLSPLNVNPSPKW